MRMTGAGIEPATFRCSVGSDCGTSLFILLRPRKRSPQAEPASVVVPVDVAAGGTGSLGNPTSSRPTNSQCHRHRVLTRTSAGTTAPRGFGLGYREPARAKRFESLS